MSGTPSVIVIDSIMERQARLAKSVEIDPKRHLRELLRGLEIQAARDVPPTGALEHRELAEAKEGLGLSSEHLFAIKPDIRT